MRLQALRVACLPTQVSKFSKESLSSFPCFIAQCRPPRFLDVCERDGASLAEVCRHFASGFALPCVGHGPRDRNYSKIGNIKGGDGLGWGEGAEETEGIHESIIP